MKPATAQIWFTPWGWTYRPTAVAGWLLLAIAALFSIQVIGEAFLAYGKVAPALFICFPYVVSAGTVYTWIASKMSAK